MCRLLLLTFFGPPCIGLVSHWPHIMNLVVFVLNNSNNINSNRHNSIYSAVIMHSYYENSPSLYEAQSSARQPPIDLSLWSASIVTIYYYLAGEPILILPSHRG